jgi:hypothetical protein
MFNDLSSIKLAESTLQEYSLALMNVESDMYQELILREFFGGKPYVTTELDPVETYEHRKIQAIWDDFFASLGYKTVKSSWGYSGKNPPITMDIEIRPNVSKKIYKHGIVFLTNGHAPICIEINLGPKQTFFYKMHSLSETSHILRDLVKESNLKNIYRGQKIDCNGRFLKLDNICWDDVVLAEGIKEIIVQNIDQMFELRDDFKRFGLSVKRGVILHGEPGTGKTKICKCLAKDAKYSVLYALPSDFASMNGIKYVCDMAKDLAPCLLIIEDIDWIAQDRTRGSAPFVMELMNKIDGIESFGDIITLGTTNCLGDLEEAIKNRPGRFDRLINIGLPDLICIQKMIKAFTRRFILDKSIDIEKLAACCEKLTGAHVYDLCNTAAINAVKDKSVEGENLLLKKSHFDEAIIEIKNKNYSSYLEMQSKGKNFGFGAHRNSFIDDYLMDNDQSAY